MGLQKPRDKPRLTINRRLISSILASIVPVVIALGVLIYSAYQEKQENISRQLQETTRTFSMVMDRELGGLLMGLEILATSPFIASSDFTRFHAQTLSALANFPGADIILADATGQQLVNSFLPIGSLLPKRNPDRIRTVFETGQASVDGLFKGAITGRLLIGVDVPVLRDGNVVFDLGMTLPVDSLIQVLSLPSLPPEWTATILDNKNMVVARTHDQEKFVGKQADMPILARHLQIAKEGVLRAIGLTGRPVLVGYSQSTKFGWTMVISVPTAYVMQDLWRWLFWTVGGATLMGILGVIAALRLGKKIAGSIQDLIGPAKALGQGEPVNIGRLEFVETNEVGESLVKASDLLMQREEALRNREMHTFEEMSSPIPSGVTASTLGQQGLRLSSPELFSDLTERFATLLDQAVEMLAFKVDYNIPKGIAEISEALGKIKAGPRDATELFLAALNKKCSGVKPEKCRAYREEGRLMLIELIGKLTTYYRNYSLGMASPSVASTM